MITINSFRIRNRSPFNGIHDISVLEKLESDIEYRNEMEPSYENKERLFFVYLRWWELDPENAGLPYIISKLVLELGWDIKRQKVNYELAQLFFEDLIRSNKPRLIPIAHYRLGFIHFYNKSYRKSIHSFENALRTPSRDTERQSHRHEMLSDSQKMKAHVQLAIALNKYSMESAIKAKQMYHDLGEPDEVDIDFIMKLEREILTEDHSPYTCLRPSGIQYLSDQAYRELKSDETAFIFDATEYGQHRLIIQGETCTLSSRRMEILELIFGKLLQPVSQRELQDELGIAQVSRYMNALREDLSRYGLNENTITAANGYRITHPNPVFIYQTADPKYMM